MAILSKQFGQRLLGDAMQEAVDGAMKEHFDASGDRPAMQPDVKMVNGEDWKEGQDVVVEMTYETLPEIPEVDAGKIVLEKLVVKADDGVGRRGAGEPRQVGAELRRQGGRRQGRGRRPGGHRLRGLDRRRGLRGRLGRGLSAGAGLGQLHPGLRGAAGRRGRRRSGRRQGDLPGRLWRRPSGRQGSGLRLRGEGGEEADRRPRSTTRWPRNTAPRTSRR